MAITHIETGKKKFIYKNEVIPEGYIKGDPAKKYIKTNKHKM